MSKEIICSGCKYHFIKHKRFDWSQDDHLCTHNDNVEVIILSRDPIYSSNTKTHYGQCKKINKNNDCKNYAPTFWQKLRDWMNS